MKNKAEVFVRGNEHEGGEVINTLVKHGGCNTLSLSGTSEGSYYYISSNGIIRYINDMELLVKAGYEEVKISPRYDLMPFTDSDEIEEACRNHGNDVRNKCGVSLFDIHKIISLIKMHHTSDEVYKHLMEFYEFADGTPCGNIVNRD